MKKIKLVIDQGALLFLKWFDGQMDRLVKPDWRYYSRLRDLCAAPYDDYDVDSPAPLPYAPQYLSQDDTTLWLAYVPPCSYLDHRLRGPDNMSGNELLLGLFPLYMELAANYVIGDGIPKSARKSSTKSEAVIITLESLPLLVQVRLVIDYRLSEADPLLWLLHTLTREYVEARDQLDLDDLDDVAYDASIAQWARWERLDWVVLARAETPRPPIGESAVASNSGSVERVETTDERASSPPGKESRDIADDQEKRYLNAAIMKTYYKNYKPETAQEIIDAIPKGRHLYECEGGRWGPGFVARFCLSKAATVGRYLKALKLAEYTHVDGIEIP